jgi:hypothetical protein
LENENILSEKMEMMFFVLLDIFVEKNGMFDEQELQMHTLDILN